MEQTQPKNPDCTCTRSRCSRHGDCAACRAHHEGKKNPPACMRQSRSERRESKKRDKS